MIARTEREARRQAALAVRQKALFEAAARPRIARVLAQAGDMAAKLYESGGEKAVEKQLPGQIVEKMEPVLYDVYRRIIKFQEDVANKEGKSLPLKVETKKVDDSVTKRMLDLFGKYAFTQSKLIAETTTQRVTGYIARLLGDEPEAIQEGPRALARQLRSYVEDLAPYQAEMIARTETLMAYSESQDTFTKELWDEEEEGQLYKRWYANQDERTRDDHRVMHMSVVKSHESFEMPDGTYMLYPGDREGGLSNLCNCRCSYSSLPEELIPESQR